MIFYHGGHLDDQNTFWPLSHFGSKNAALDRIKDNFEEQQSFAPIRQFLYRCEVDLGSNVINLPDWHAAVPSGVILAFANANILKMSRVEQLELIKPINSIQWSQPLEARLMVLKVINHLGISAIRYPNQHEGNIGDYSYCVVHSSDVRVLDYREIEQP